MSKHNSSVDLEETLTYREAALVEDAYRRGWRDAWQEVFALSNGLKDD